MNKAVEHAFDFADDEEGAAAAAASLGPDGNPDAGAAGQDLAVADDEEFDESWLDEELTDEELAALGEEDFDEEDIDVEAFDEDDLLAEELGLDAGGDETENEFAIGDLDFSDEQTVVVSSSEELPEEIGEEPLEDFSEDETVLVADAAGAIVASGQTALEGVNDDDILEAGLGEDDVDHRPVPRISISAFCETPETSALLERAGVDRRLSKTHLTIHMGGLPKAVDHFQSTSTPNLVILETLDGGAQLFEQLGQLAEVCDPSTKVIIIGKINDIGLYRELVRQGISEYIVRPKSPLQIIKSIASLYVDPSAAPIGKTIAFVGARGGAGSSTMAHNVGWCAAEEMESDTIIVDLDLPFGTASLDFEQDPTAGLAEALGSPERLDDVLLDRLLQKHTDHLSLFTAPNLLDRDYDIADDAFDTVIDIVRNAAPTIIIDVPHMWASWTKRLLQSADEIVVTATSDLASFRNAKNLIDVISGARPNDTPPMLLVNQFDPKLSAVQPEQYEEHVGLKPAAVIHWEPQLFHTASTNAAPIVEVGDKTKTAQSIREIAAAVLGRTIAPQKTGRFDLSALFKKKK